MIDCKLHVAGYTNLINIQQPTHMINDKSDCCFQNFLALIVTREPSCLITSKIRFFYC